MNTDDIRREMVESGQPAVDLLETLSGNTPQTWDTEQLRADFEVVGFAAPFVVVKRRSDGAKGTLEFTHSPRVYFGWTVDS